MLRESRDFLLINDENVRNLKNSILDLSHLTTIYTHTYTQYKRNEILPTKTNDWLIYSETMMRVCVVLYFSLVCDVSNVKPYNMHKSHGI